MEQIELLSYTYIARNSDPVSSHLAAQEITVDGPRGRQQFISLHAVIAKPGLTSRELASTFSLDRYVVARRLPEIEQAGLIVKGDMRECAISGKQAVTWWPTGE